MKIALSGKQRAGKDTFADYLVKHHGYAKFSIAEEIKAIALKNFRITKDSKNGRVFLQRLGLLPRELISESFWIEKLWQDIQYMDNVIITDVRYRDEGYFFSTKGFKMIRIESLREERVKRGVLSGEDNISETDLDDYKHDYWLENNNTLLEFNDSLGEVFELIKE